MSLQKPDKNLLQLARKWLLGTISPKEKAEFDQWYNGFDDTRHEVNIGLSEQDLENKLHQAIFEKAGIINDTNTVKKTVQLWPRIAAAASIILVLAIGAYFYKVHQPNTITNQPVKNDIAPGKNAATLTLANGQKIILSSAATGQIAKQAGVNITKAVNGQVTYSIASNNTAAVNQFNTLSTARGETYKINLPDGTQVWLNASSSLTYPARFTGIDRKVKLTGEGYFEVAKDKNHPFKVNTDKQEVTVLGTHFNINAYNNESATKTTLLEGSVKVSAVNGSQIIKPGQQASLQGNNIKVQDIDATQTIAWKDNNFDFEGEDLRYIMRMVERWYNVEVIYEDYNSDEKFYGGVSRYQNVSEVLKSLESTKKIHFRIDGRKIFVSK